MSKSGTTISYGYNADGMRISKTVNGTKTEYSYLGSQLVEMKKGSDTLHFTYDSLGPATVVYNGTTYYYLKNAQGDVYGITNSSGSRVVSYSYDAWGKLLSTTGSAANGLGALNPLRYRGYVYDNETEFYYLQTRYYNPEICRFINADGYASTGQGVLGSNAFAYCENNPVCCNDSQGTFVNTITGLVVGAVVGAFNAWNNGDNIWAGAGIGAASGALAGIGADLAIATGGIGALVFAGGFGAASGAGNYMVTEYANGRKPTGKRIAIEATIGAISNMLTFGVGDGSLTKRGGNIFKNLVSDAKKTLTANATKMVGNTEVYKTNAATHIICNATKATAETAAIGFSSWLQTSVWGNLIP